MAGDGPFGVVELPAFGGPDEGAGAVVGVVVQAGLGQRCRDPDRRSRGAKPSGEGDADDDLRVGLLRRIQARRGPSGPTRTPAIDKRS